MGKDLTEQMKEMVSEILLATDDGSSLKDEELRLIGSIIREEYSSIKIIILAQIHFEVVNEEANKRTN